MTTAGVLSRAADLGGGAGVDSETVRSGQAGAGLWID